LGVLKEKRDGDDSSVADSDDESPYANAANNDSGAQGDSDVLGKLMGGKKSDKSDADKPSIEEMAE
jgi:hypothetical protein